MTRDELISALDKITADGALRVENGFQAQYRNTNIEKLVKGILEIRKKYLSNALKSLYADNLNLSTAKGDGLDLWGLLINFSRFVLVEVVDAEKPLYYKLDDKDYRNLLMVLYQKQFINGNVDNINKFSQNALGTDYGDVIVRDTQDMTFLIYKFNKVIPINLKWILSNKDILLRPAGVGVKVVEEIVVSDSRFIGFAPDESDKTTNPTAYNERMAWFEKNIGNFDNTQFGLNKE